MMIDTFSIVAYSLLVLLMALTAWWAVRSYKKTHWMRFSVALILFVLLGFGWNFFPVLLFLIVGPFLGLSFS